MRREQNLSRRRSSSSRARLLAALAVRAALAALLAPAASAADRSVAVIVVPRVRACGIRRPRRRRAARARRGGRRSRASGRSPRSSAVGWCRRSSISVVMPACGSRAPPARDDDLRRRFPPPGRTTTSSRYPIAIVGPGYRGLLTSPADPDRRARLTRRHRPDRGGRRRGRTAADSCSCGRRCGRDARPARHVASPGPTTRERARRSCSWAGSSRSPSLGILARSAIAGRAAVLVAPVALTAALALRAIGVDAPGAVVLALAFVTGAGSLLLGLRRALLAPAVVCFLVVFIVDPGRLAGDQRPGGDRTASGRRRTVLRRHEPGGDAAARAVARGCRDASVSQARWRSGSCFSSPSGGAGPGPTEAGFSSSPRLSRCCSSGSGGRGSLRHGRHRDDRRARGRRWRSWASTRCSEARATSPTPSEAARARSSTISAGGSGSRGPARRPPPTRRSSACSRSEGSPGSGSGASDRPTIVAMLVAIGVSLLVNDTPVDVLGYGALGCLALTAWEETRALSASRVRSSASSHLREPPEHVCALTERSRRTMPGSRRREADGSVGALRRGSLLPCASTATSSPRCGSGRGGRARG